jgi:histidine triad (HIT) family protein
VEGCAFCAIVAGVAPAEIICREAEALAFLDIHPAAPGHTLVIPCRHSEDICALDETSAAAIMRLAVRVARALRIVLHPDGLNVVQSSGRAAGQEILHTHLHLIPRWFGDGLSLGRPPTVHRGEPLAALARRLRDELGKP